MMTMTTMIKPVIVGKVINDDVADAPASRDIVRCVLRDRRCSARHLENPCVH